MTDDAKRVLYVTADLKHIVRLKLITVSKLNTVHQHKWVLMAAHCNASVDAWSKTVVPTSLEVILNA